MYVCMYIYVYIHIHMHTNIHTNTFSWQGLFLQCAITHTHTHTHILMAAGRACAFHVQSRSWTLREFAHSAECLFLQSAKLEDCDDNK
jgi:hypothetical protein